MGTHLTETTKERRERFLQSSMIRGREPIKIGTAASWLSSPTCTVSYQAAADLLYDMYSDGVIERVEYHDRGEKKVRYYGKQTLTGRKLGRSVSNGSLGIRIAAGPQEWQLAR